MLARRLFPVVLLGLWSCLSLSAGHAADNHTPQPGTSTPAPQPCPAAATPEASAERITLQANSLEYQRDSNRVIATGQVSIQYGGKMLQADQVELNRDTNQGIAWGNVRFQTPDDDIRAVRLDFDLNTERGVLYDSTGKVAKIYQIAGERIERENARTFTVQRGRITTCLGARPDWEVRAVQSTIGLGDYITMQQPSFWIKGIPVFYVPYFILPIKEKRATGFLIPRLGYSERDGAVVHTEFFWAMTEWLDSTLGLEYLSARGWKPEVEVRYALDPLSDGQIKGAYLHDQKTGETLWRMLLQQRQDFGWNTYGVSQIDLRSRGDIVRRFSRAIDEESAIRTASYATLSKLWPNSTLSLSGQSYDGIREADAERYFRRLPQVRFEQFPTPLFGGRAAFALEASYSNLSASSIRQGDPVQRFDVYPHLTVPLALRPWMNLTVTGGVRETFVDHQAVRDEETSRMLVDVRANLEGPTLWRRYPGVAGAQALIHVLETRLAYRYVPHVSQRLLPPFEALDEDRHFLDPLETLSLIDRIAAANYTKVSLVNRLFAHTANAAGARSLREVAQFTISQGIDLRAANTEQGQWVGPLDIDLNLRIWQPWRFASTVRLLPASGTLQEASVQAGFQPWDGWSLTLTGYHREEPATDYLSGAVLITPYPGLRLGYNARYDARLGTFREHLATLYYQAQCWRVEARVRLSPLGKTDFFVQLNLLNL